MCITGLVVLRCPPHQPFTQRLDVELCWHLPSHHLFDEVQQGTAIAIGHFQQRLTCLASQGQCRILLFFSPLAQKLKISQRQAL